jgi:hypothetical protein
MANEPKKKESWFSRLSSSIAQMKNSFKKKEPEKEATDDAPDVSSQLLASQLSAQLSQLKTILAEADKKTAEAVKSKGTQKTYDTEDEFEIGHFDKKYNGLNISAPILKKKPTNASETLIETKKVEAVQESVVEEQKSVLEIRKEFIEEIKRLKKAVAERDAASDEANILKSKLMDDLKQVKEILKETATPEEKKTLSDLDFD